MRPWREQNDPIEAKSQRRNHTSSCSLPDSAHVQAYNHAYTGTHPSEVPHPTSPPSPRDGWGPEVMGISSYVVGPGAQVGVCLRAWRTSGFKIRVR